MEKISGIIPSSPRVSNVDIREAPPVRPGAPGFGRGQGVSTEKVSQELTGAGAVSARGPLDWKSKDQQKAAMAAQVSDSFFMKSQPAGFKDISSRSRTLAAAHFNDQLTEQNNDQIKEQSMPQLSSFFIDSQADEASLEQPEGLYPKGSFIDRTA